MFSFNLFVFCILSYPATHGGSCNTMFRFADSCCGRLRNVGENLTECCTVTLSDTFNRALGLVAASSSTWSSPMWTPHHHFDIFMSLEGQTQTGCKKNEGYPIYSWVFRSALDLVFNWVMLLTEGVPLPFCGMIATMPNLIFLCQTHMVSKMCQWRHQLGWVGQICLTYRKVDGSDNMYDYWSSIAFLWPWNPGPGSWMVVELVDGIDGRLVTASGKATGARIDGFIFISQRGLHRAAT